jgi:hypothetical protein
MKLLLNRKKLKRRERRERKATRKKSKVGI